jgi:hypothetical protein
VKKESGVQSIINNENPKEKEANAVEETLRPCDIGRFSEYPSEMEVLFGPHSSFKIDSLPKKGNDDLDFEYYEIMLEYIDTFVSPEQTVFMNELIHSSS